MFPSKLLFITACIPLRLALAYLAKTQPGILSIMGLGYLVLGIAMMAIYFLNLRPVGTEAGGRIWWNSIRPLHGILYFIFSYLALTGSSEAWKVLVADVVLGLAAWGFHHFV
jgi:hypothetical protein